MILRPVYLPPLSAHDRLRLTSMRRRADASGQLSEGLAEHWESFAGALLGERPAEGMALTAEGCWTWLTAIVEAVEADARAGR